MKICVISDLHFKYTSPNADDMENSRIVLEFLDQARGKYDLLVLNGDIFDLWYDWKYCIIKQFFPLLVKLYELSRSGCRIVQISGNHDFWFGDFLPEYLKVELVDEAFCLESDGKKIHICHGDTHTVNDFRYKLFRRVIRLPLTKLIFGFLHPDIALGVGSKMSRSSRARKDTAGTRKRKNQGLEGYARALIVHGKADYVVMGHSHEPLLKEIDGGFYVNSGDWVSHHSYVEIISGTIKLKHYNDNGDTE
jgi:UDP-2,3-diacylglucosamine hydrolase